jgi:hypothetical protein
MVGYLDGREAKAQAIDIIRGHGRYVLIRDEELAGAIDVEFSWC